LRENISGRDGYGLDMGWIYACLHACRQNDVRAE
jgi:hypothetical protein